LRGEVNHNCLRAVVADGDLLRGNSCGCRRGACCLSYVAFAGVNGDLIAHVEGADL
jgi:hypothetical protein